jgi:hypothetical protein
MESCGLSLFADVGAGQVAAIAAISTTIGVVLKTILDFVWGWVKDRRGDQKEENKSLTDHLTARVGRLEAEKEKQDKRQRNMSRRMRRAENSNTQMLAHILYLERQMTAAKLPFDPFKEIPLPPDDEEDEHKPPGTDTHSPVGGS